MGWMHGAWFGLFLEKEKLRSWNRGVNVEIRKDWGERERVDEVRVIDLVMDIESEEIGRKNLMKESCMCICVCVREKEITQSS